MDLFPLPSKETLDPGAVVLRNFAGSLQAALLENVAAIAAAAPFRNLVTPGGRVTSVAIPCHRAVRRDGGLAGFRWGVEMKRVLLEQEASA